MSEFVKCDRCGVMNAKIADTHKIRKITLSTSATNRADKEVVKDLCQTCAIAVSSVFTEILSMSEDR